MTTAATEPLFISYRRSDSGASAKQLHRRLEDWFGPGSTFLDTGSIEAGAVFPKRLERAVKGAKAVIVVLGPTWLTALKQRATQPAEVDYVRVEVESALQRHAAGKLSLLLPLLVDGADMAMLGAAQLAPADWPAISPLAKVNAMALRAASWEPDFTALRTLLAEATALKPAPPESSATTLKRAAAEVRGLLEREALRPLGDRWGADPVTASGGADVVKLLSDFDQALRASQPDLQHRATRPAAVREACRAVLSQLYRLAVDRSAAREWGGAAPSPRAVPAQTAGTVSMVHAVANGVDLNIAEHTVSNRFIAERTADLDQVDAGIGDDRRAFAHGELWRLLNPGKAYPGGEKSPLGGAALDDLKDSLWARSQLKRGYVLTGVVGSSTQAAADFATFAAELNVAAIGRTGSSGPLLSVGEGKLNALVCAILEEIEKIQ